MDSSPAPAGAAPRTLVACGKCGRQYDATGFALGQELCCSCGATIEVRTLPARTARRLRCAHCGAELPPEGERCTYCSAAISLEERGLAELCPCCGARLFAGARYCMDCGVSIAPQSLTALGADRVCPRCAGALRTRALEQSELVECSSCAGLWVEAHAFEGLCRTAETSRLSASVISSALPASRAAVAQREGYLPCLNCGQLMLRKNFGGSSGVVIDLCRDHGVWLDHRELERILEFVSKGGLLRARENEVRRLELEGEHARDASGTALPALGSSWIEPEQETGALDGFLGLLGSAFAGVLRPRR